MILITLTGRVIKKNNATCVNSLQKAQFCNVVKNIL